MIGLSGRATVNLEGFAAVAFLAAMLLLARRPQSESANTGVSARSGEIGRCLLIVGIALAAYWRSVGNPLLFDDYVHLLNARDESFGGMLSRSLWTHPQGGDYFFRPLGYLTYWLDFRWAGTNPLPWHLWNLLIHSANSLLVYLLGRELRLRGRSACVAAAFFAVQASHVEVVCWMAARFDLLAFFFAVFCLIAIKRSWFPAMAIACLLAALSKEAAFCLPLLALCLIAFEPAEWKKIAGAAAALGVICLSVFAYRTWFLGGLGGYQSHLKLVKTLEALLFREWSVLFFPVNWAVGPGYALLAGLGLIAAAGIVAAAYCRASRLAVLGCLGFIVAAALPVAQLLLIDSELSGARVLYLPSLGLALLAGVLYEGFTRSWARGIFAGCLLLFQIAALEHNITIWDDVAALARRACEQMASQGDAEVADLPRLYHGVFFLANGFPQCVVIHGGQAVKIAAQRRPGVFVWNPESHKMERLR